MLNSLSDVELVDVTLNGDLGAFEELIQRYQKNVVKSLFRFCPQPSDLEDLVQETMLKAYHKLDTWKPEAPFLHWLRKIAYNVGYDHFRKMERESIFENGEEFFLSEKVIERKNQQEECHNVELVQKLLSFLSSDERLLLTLQYLEDISLPNIATQMGWSYSKTKVVSFRAKKKLKKILEKNGIQEF